MGALGDLPAVFSTAGWLGAVVLVAGVIMKVGC